MSSRTKMTVVEGVSLDLISNLPGEVITHILDFLPLRDVAKTSVLSRKWRNIWASHPYIKISYDSPVMKERKKGATLKVLSNIINKILLRHIGPVLKFSLKFPFFPSNENFHFTFLGHWLSYLSSNGIKELTLNLENLTRETCILPSHIFSAPELVVLNLSYIIFDSPNGHADFRKLTILNCCHVDFGLLRVTSTINTPQLTFLSLKFCTKVCNFKIFAPKLDTLILDGNMDFDLISFEMPEISTVALMGGENISLTELFERCRTISSLYVHGLGLPFFVSDALVERLPLMNICLKHLVVEFISWGDLPAISRFVNLLQSSTTLLRLEISGGASGNRLTKEVSNYLDAAHTMSWMVNSLEIVVIAQHCFCEDELRFIKFLLSRAPRLKKMFVKETEFFGNESNDNSILKLAKRLMRLPRASNEAEIIFEPNVRVAKIPEVSSLR